MVVSDAINNIMGGMESTAGVRLHNHRRKLRQRFDIIKKLGQGTYGKVQLGINKETGQEVAIKTIKKSKIETEADLVRIRREIQIMSSVQHPNIIHIYEVFENREKMVLVMEYAAGGELYDFLSERKVLAEAEARRIFRQIATAVFYCHKHNICHRDLKLENILLDEHGAAKIADFGLSNVFDDQRLLATFCGSPLYASPEIVRGTPYRGPEVDCWSLGVLLYTLVYGAMPFDGSNFKRLVKQISNGEYFEPKKPSPASGLIRAMLCVDPATRADIGAVCSDAWINEGAGHTCIELAEELAAQTPVRLDLLLSLAPAAVPAAGAESTPVEPLSRSRSVGALMELDKARMADSGQRRSSAAGQEPVAKDLVAAKRKLEEGSSTEEANTSGAKRKERSSRRRDRSVERTGERKTRSASRSKQPKAKNEEPAAVVPATSETPPESMEVDVEVKPAGLVDSEVKEDKCEAAVVEAAAETATEEAKVTDDAKKVKVKRKKKVAEDSGSKEDVSVSESSQIAEKPKEPITSKEPEVAVVETEKVAEVKTEEAEKPKAVKKTGTIKKKAEPAKSAEEDVAKPMVRRRSKVFESEIQKFNNPEPKSPVADKPKKVFIPGVKVSDFKRAYERKSSADLSSAVAAVPSLNTSPSKTAVVKTEPEPKDTIEAVAVEPVIKTVDPVLVAKPVETVLAQNEPPASQNVPVPAHNVPIHAQTEPVPSPKDPAPAAAAVKPAPTDLAAKKKNAIEIIGAAIAKPPKPLDKLKMKPRSPPDSPRSEMNKVLESLKSPESSGRKVVKVQVGPNDVRNAILQVSTPELVENFKFEERDRKPADAQHGNAEPADRPKVSTKVEITLKSATLPRRKTSKAEIRLESPLTPKPEFRTQVQHSVAAVGPKLPTQRSEVAFPVAAPQNSQHRSMSVEPESAVREKPKERIIPIQFAREPDDRPPLQSQRSNQSNQSARSSLSRQSTLDSDAGDSVPLSAEPIRKSPREFIIPIAVEGGGFVTPRAASLEPGAGVATGQENKRKPMRFARPLRMSSLLSESDDDCFSPFSPGGRHREGDSGGIDDEFGAHMHQLRSSRPSRFPTERADSVSSGEDDDDDNFELLTAESLFSTLLSRVRNLTQRLNTDDGRPSFPSSRFMNHNFPSRSSFFSEPLSRRVSETSQFSRQSSRDRSCDRDSNHSSSTLRSGNSNATLPRSTNSNSTLPRSGNSNASLPRAQSRTDSSSSIYTPSMSRRLLANQEAPLPRNSSNSSLPTSRAAARPVSRTGSLKSSDGKARTPSSFLHRSGSESLEGNEGKARFNEPPLRGYDNARPYESQTKVSDAPRLYDTLPRSYDASPHPYDASTRSYETPQRSYDTSPRSYDTSPRSYDTSPRSYDASPRSYDTPSRSYDTLPRSCDAPPRPYESYPSPYESRLPSPYDRGESGDVYSSGFPRRNATGSLPRRHAYRSAMSDTLDYSRPEEPRPPLPGRRLPRSTSYLRQRALDIANVYAAPLGDESDYAERLADFRSRRSATPNRSLNRAGSVARETSAAAEPGFGEGVVRRQKSFDGVDKLKRPTSLDLRATPERSVLGKLLGDQEEAPVSPVKSPGRRVSRFLRPDFYDTAREDSAFVKVKAEEERERRNGGAGSRQLGVANFLEGNHADLERNIAEGLRAIGDLGAGDKAKSDKGSAWKAAGEKGEVFNGTPELWEKAGEGSKEVASPVSLSGSEKRVAKVDDSSEASVAKIAAKSGLERNEAKENGAKIAAKSGLERNEAKENGAKIAAKSGLERNEAKENGAKIAAKSGLERNEAKENGAKIAAKSGLERNEAKENGAKMGEPKIKEAGKSVGKLEQKVAQESVAKEGDMKDKSALKSIEVCANSVSADLEKNGVKVNVSKDLLAKNAELPKNIVKVEKIVPKEKTVDGAVSNDKSVTESPAGLEKAVKDKVVREGSIKLSEAAKMAKLEKIATKEQLVTAPSSNLPVKEIPSPVSVGPKKVVELPKVDTSVEKANKPEAKTQNGSIPNIVGAKSLGASDSNGVSNKEEAATKLPTKIKLKKKVKKDPESSPKEVTEEAKSKPKPETTNRSKFLRTLDKTIDKFEETVKRPVKLVRETSLAPVEAPSISALVKRAVSVDDCSAQPPEKSPNKIKRVIDSLKELATAPKPTPDSENSLLKRATSVDDMTNPSQTKTNQVSSMLGRFRKLEEPKKSSLLSRFRKTQSVYGGSTSDGVLALDGDGGKRASLGPESFEGINDASCSVIVRRNSVKKAEEKVDSDADVSISATVKVVKVVKDESIVNGLAKDESVNGKKLSGIGQPNVDSKRSKQNSVSDAYSKQSELRNETNPIKISEPKENGAGFNEDSITVPKRSQTNGSSSLPKPTKPTNSSKSDDSSLPRNGSIAKGKTNPVGPVVKVGVVVGQPPVDGRSTDLRKTRDASEDCDSLDSASSGRFSPLLRPMSPLLPRPMSPLLDGPVESIEARIRRKSFYSRFNDAKKQPPRKASAPALRNSESGQAVDADPIQ